MPHFSTHAKQHSISKVILTSLRQMMCDMNFTTWWSWWGNHFYFVLGFLKKLPVLLEIWMFFFVGRMIKSMLFKILFFVLIPRRATSTKGASEMAAKRKKKNKNKKNPQKMANCCFCIPANGFGASSPASAHLFGFLSASFPSSSQRNKKYPA